MKKLILTLIVLLCLTGTGNAAWSVSSTLSTVRNYPGSTFVHVAVTTDGSAQSSALDLFPLVPEKLQQRLRSGGFVYGIRSIPDIDNAWPITHVADAPAGAYTFTITDELGSTMTFTDESHTAANDAVIGDNTDTGMYFMANGALDFTTTYSGTSGETFFIVFILLR